MISLLADVTRHLTILTFMVQFEFSLSCQCYLTAMPRWRYRFFCLYMMAYKQHQESCCQCSKSPVDVRGAPSNPSNARPFEQEMRSLNRQNGGCVHLQKWIQASASSALIRLHLRSSSSSGLRAHEGRSSPVRDSSFSLPSALLQASGSLP
jgi:hypothetical protein